MASGEGAIPTAPATTEKGAGHEARAIPAAERIHLLDALRGLAIFGILLANIHYWSGWGFLDDAGKAALAGPAAAGVTRFLHDLLIDGKFYTIFSFLFGVGFALQLSRLERRSDKSVSIYVRRLVVLLAIGLTHLLLIWEGDILTLYALAGLALLLVRRRPDSWLLKAALVLLVLPVAAQGLLWLSGGPIDTGLRAFGDRLFASLGGTPGQSVEWIGRREDAASYFAWTVSGWPFRLDDLIQSWRVPKVFAIMLLGLWAGRRVVAGTLLDDRRLLRRVLAWGLIVGAPANFALGLLGGLEQGSPAQAFWASLAYALGVVPLGLAYAAGFALAWPRAGKWLGLLAAPGRMALTNYLLHSILGIVIFFGIGFGLMGRLGPPGFFGVALAIFAGQVLLSHLWLARFGQGPVERLWRLGTYGRRMKPPALVPTPA